MMTQMELKLAESLLESNKRVVELLQVIEKLESTMKFMEKEILELTAK